MGRVRIGTCAGPADAAFVRAAFDAHQIHVVINAEQHASVLGGLGGALTPLHIYVHEEDAEDAAALLADLRREDREPADAEGPEAAGGPDAPDAPGAEDPRTLDEQRAEAEVDLRAHRRRRTAIALFAGCCMTLGLAHVSVGAYLRALLLAAVEIFGMTRVASGDLTQGFLIVGACVLTDVIGALLIIASSPPPLPPARVRPRP